MNKGIKKFCITSLASLLLVGVGVSTSNSFNANASRHSLPSKFYGHWYGTSYQYKNGKRTHKIYPINIYYGKYGGYIISHNKHKSYNNAYDAYTGRLHETHWVGNAYHDYEGKYGNHMLSNVNFLPKPHNHILSYNNGARGWYLHKVSNRRAPAKKHNRNKKVATHGVYLKKHNRVYVARANNKTGKIVTREKYMSSYKSYVKTRNKRLRNIKSLKKKYKRTHVYSYLEKAAFISGILKATSLR